MSEKSPVTAVDLLKAYKEIRNQTLQEVEKIIDRILNLNYNLSPIDLSLNKLKNGILVLLKEEIKNLKSQGTMVGLEKGSSNLGQPSRHPDTQTKENTNEN